MRRRVGNLLTHTFRELLELLVGVWWPDVAEESFLQGRVGSDWLHPPSGLTKYPWGGREERGRVNSQIGAVVSCIVSAAGIQRVLSRLLALCASGTHIYEMT